VQQYRITATRLGPHGSLAARKQAEIALDTDPAGRQDAFNPAELLLAAVAACMIKGIERVTPMISFDLRVEVIVRANAGTILRLVSIEYEILVDTGEATAGSICSYQCPQIRHRSTPSRPRPLS
jgi:uncharacterized OsmC-like protein